MMDGSEERHDELVQWEGLVRKKGDWLPRWEERYLVLSGATLTYYNSKAEAQLNRNMRGRMVLSKVSTEDHGKAHGFLIETLGHKHFHLCCRTKIEKELWIEMMKTAIERGIAPRSLTTTPSYLRMNDDDHDYDHQSTSGPSTSTPMDLTSFYAAFRQMLVHHSSSVMFFPHLSRDLILRSNYQPTVPFWGEYHGIDGMLTFLSILNETVDFQDFHMTEIAQESQVAVIMGKETMKNRYNGRQFSQQWQHTLVFGADRRIQSWFLRANAVAASTVFGSQAVSRLNVPKNIGRRRRRSRPEHGNTRSPDTTSLGSEGGTFHVNVHRGQDLELFDDTVAQVKKYWTTLDLLYGNQTSIPPSFYHRNQAQDHLKTTAILGMEWQAQDQVDFQGITRGECCSMIVTVWVTTTGTTHDESNENDVILGLVKINLMPFLVLEGSADRDENVDEKHVWSSRTPVPQWYTLHSPHDRPCGRIHLSISFQEQSPSLLASLEEDSTTGIRPPAPPTSVNDAQLCPSSTSAPEPELPRVEYSDNSRSSGGLRQEHQHQQLVYVDTRTQNHTFKIGSTVFDIPTRYQLIKAVGQGAYGCVIAVSEVDTATSLAIKNIPQAFHDLTDAKRICREIRLGRHLRHPNLVNIVDLIRPKSVNAFEDVYIVTDLMETDLHRVIHSTHQSLSDDHIQVLLYQLLRAISYCHSARVIHRDLKPSNILVNSDCDLKLCDFGLARGIGGLESEESVDLTEYVVTRWYRAPELLLASRYNEKIDIWSIGCILAELLLSKPLFPGQDYLDQLKLILTFLGTPARVSFITNAKAKKFIAKQPKRPKKPWHLVFPRGSNPVCLDLLDRMLTFDPERRISAAEALAHPYFDDIDFPSPSLEEPPEAFNFDFEACAVTKANLQALIFEDVCYFHPEAKE